MTERRAGTNSTHYSVPGTEFLGDQQGSFAKIKPRATMPLKMEITQPVPLSLKWANHWQTDYYGLSNQDESNLQALLEHASIDFLTYTWFVSAVLVTMRKWPIWLQRKGPLLGAGNNLVYPAPISCTVISGPLPFLTVMQDLLIPLIVPRLENCLLYRTSVKRLKILNRKKGRKKLSSISIMRMIKSLTPIPWIVSVPR